jgi:hypothetical protein
MPPEISDALFGKGAPEIRREIPAADEPFGIFAKVTPLPADPDIDEPFDYEHPLTKLLASDMPVALAAFSGGPSYVAEPTRFLGDDIDAEDREDFDAIEPLRRMFREGAYFGTLDTAAPEPLAKRVPVIRENVAPTPPAKTDAPERTVKFRDSHGSIWREEFDASNSLVSAMIVEDPDEVDKARRDSSFEKRDEVLAKDETGNVESISEMLISAFENLDGQGADESDEDFCERLSAELRRLGMRPKLS